MLGFCSRGPVPLSALAVAVALASAHPQRGEGSARAESEHGNPRRGPLLQIPLGLDLLLPVPEHNPLSRERVELGRHLFFETRLSQDRATACATCHQPETAFTDGKTIAEGVFGRKGTRNTPTLINRGYGQLHFFDGRAASLEEQALQPIEHPDELGVELEYVIDRLRRDAEYAAQFRSTFEREVNREDLARALASYLRTILSGNAPIDRYQAGDPAALSREEREGLRIFRGKGNCIFCHVGPNLSDEKFHNTGVAWRHGAPLDPGRFFVSGEPRDLGAFKTPTLREISRTAPYMHDGSLETLEQVIDFYDRGGIANPHLDLELRPLDLNGEEKEALLSFLGSLSGELREGVPEVGASD